MKSIQHIKNPLTVIGIFASLAEVCGTVIFLKICPELQNIFIWFVIGFPVLLVFLFFLTLNFNPTVLYAPSDFKNEDNFLRSLRKQTPEEQREKIKHEAQSSLPSTVVTDTKPQEIHATAVVSLKRKYHESLYLLAEDLALRKLESLLGTSIERQMRYGDFRFDGVTFADGHIVAIQIKYIRSALLKKKIFDNLLLAGEKFSKALKNRGLSFKLIITIVHSEIKKEEILEIKKEIASFFENADYPVEISMFDFDDLQKEFGLYE